MGNRERSEINVDALVASYRDQIASGRPISHAKAGAAGGCSRRTAARFYKNGAAARGDSGPLPPLRELATNPVPTEVTAAVSTEVERGATATASAPAAIPVAAAPAPALSVAPSVEDQEAAVVGAFRHSSAGLATVVTQLLGGLVPLAVAARQRLELTAKSGDADPRFVANLTEQISTTLSKAAGAVERLVAAQSVLSGRATVTRERLVEPPEPLDEDATAGLRMLGQFVRQSRRAPPGAYSGEEGGAGVIDVRVSPARSGQLVATDEIEPLSPAI